MAQQNIGNQQQQQDQVDHVAGRSPTAVTHALKGAHFPASKQQLLQHAQQQPDTDQQTLQVLQAMPEGTYQQMADVTHNMSRAVRTVQQQQG